VDDAEACDAIVAGLPYFFGDPTGVRDCAEAVRTQHGIVAVVDGEVSGFVTLLAHNPSTTEITWMAVRSDRRRSGIGHRLIEEAARRVAANGARMLCVLTLGPSEPEPDVPDNYAGTRAFYEAAGFVPLRELELRSWNNGYALMLARPL
jgi:GNAT superfamily N-acetyltransferase